MKTKTTKYVGFKAENVGDNYVEGYASTFGAVDSYNDIVEKGAFTRTLKARKGGIRFLKYHDPNQPIGKVVEIREDEKGLWVKAVFSSTRAGQEARTEVLEGVLDSFSIGFMPVKAKTDKLADGRIVNRIQEVKLYEFSLVTFPANEEAVVTGVKAEGEGPALNEANQALLESYRSYLLSKQADDEPEAEDEEEETDEEAEAEEPADDVSEEEPDEEDGEEKMMSKALADAIIILKVQRELRNLRK